MEQRRTNSPYQPKTITIALSTVMGRPIELRLHRRASKKRNNRQESTRVADGFPLNITINSRITVLLDRIDVHKWMDKRDSRSDASLRPLEFEGDDQR